MSDCLRFFLHLSPFSYLFYYQNYYLSPIYRQSLDLSPVLSPFSAFVASIFISHYSKKQWLYSTLWNIVLMMNILVGCSHEVAASDEPFCFVRLLVSSMISYTFTGEQARLSSMDYRKAEGRKVWNTLSGSGMPWECVPNVFTQHAYSASCGSALLR